MSMLKSYSFGKFCGVNEIPQEVLSLFTELVLVPEKKCSCVGEIVVNGLKGRIDCNKTFNMGAYETTIRKNTLLHKYNDLQRQVAIDYNGSSENDDKKSKSDGTISVEVLNQNMINKLKGAYDDFEDNDELKYAISFIKELQPVMFVEEKADLIGVIKKALEGKSESVMKLKELCDKYVVVAEQIRIILQSGFSFEECFAL